MEVMGDQSLAVSGHVCMSLQSPGNEQLFTPGHLQTVSRSVSDAWNVLCCLCSCSWASGTMSGQSVTANAVAIRPDGRGRGSEIHYVHLASNGP